MAQHGEPINQQSCQTCGTCPTCGNRPTPQITNPWYYQPTWVYRVPPSVPYPAQITWGTTGDVSGSDTTYYPNSAAAPSVPISQYIRTVSPISTVVHKGVKPPEGF